MPTYRDEGIVLRTHKLGEADRIVTVLTRTRGKVRGVARGVRRTSSKFGGRLEPFTHVDLQFVQGRNLDLIVQAESLHAYGSRLGLDYGSYTCGELMLEIADKLVWEEKQPAMPQYRLLQGALRALDEGTCDGPRPATMILDAYWLRALAIAGYAPALTACAQCGLAGPHSAFSPVAGGMVCPKCRPSGAVNVSTKAWELLRALLSGDWVDTRDVRAGTQREVSGLVMAFATWQFDHNLRSVAMVERNYESFDQQDAQDP